MTFKEQIEKFGIISQLAFITDISNNIYNNIHIIKFENLINEFKNFLINNNIEISKINEMNFSKINTTVYIKNNLSKEELNLLNDKYSEEINIVLALLSE